VTGITTNEEPASPATDGPKRIDLDAARKARREKQGPAPCIVFLGVERPLPRSLPAEVLDLAGLVSQGQWTGAVPAIKLLLGGEVYEQVIADAKKAGDPLELEDIVFLLEQSLEVYEVTLPESRASAK